MCYAIRWFKFKLKPPKNQGEVVEPVEPEPERKLNEEQKKDETENKSDVV